MNEKLWAIYVPGPDEYHAMPSRDAAELAARQHNNSGCIEHIAGQLGMDREALLVSVCEWPGDADDHAEELAAALSEARAAALQRIAMAAGVESVVPEQIADRVCALLALPVLSAGVLSAAENLVLATKNTSATAADLLMKNDSYTNALVEYTEAEQTGDYDAEFAALVAAEESKVSCEGALSNRLDDLDRRRERMRQAIDEYRTGRAEFALAALLMSRAQLMADGSAS